MNRTTYKTPGCCQRVSKFDRRECDAQGEKMRCLSEAVTHLKAVKGDKHAIKKFDRELECKKPALPRLLPLRPSSLASESALANIKAA